MERGCWPEDRVWAFLGSLPGNLTPADVCETFEGKCSDEKTVVSVTLFNISSSARWLSQRSLLENLGGCRSQLQKG